MVKRVLIIIFILALSFLIIRCRGLSSDSAMHIQPAVLTEKESQIMQLVKPSYASNRESIECEKEIPLAMQVFTSKDEINSCGVEFFGKPEEIQKSGYEEVYAVTIKFSNYELI